MNTLVESDALLQLAPMAAQAQKQPAGQRVPSRRRTEASIPPHATAAVSASASASGWTQKTLATLDVPAGAPQPQRRADDIVVARNSNSSSNVQSQQSSMASPSAGRHHNELRLELVSSPLEGSSSSSSTQPLPQPSVAVTGAPIGAGGRRSHRTRGAGEGGGGGGGGHGQQQEEGGPFTFAGAFPFARNLCATTAEAAVSRDLVAGQPQPQPPPPSQQQHAQSQHTQRKFSAEHSVRALSVIRV